MCTISFINRPRGYVLAMNRDEQRARVAGRPPERKTVQGCAVLSPSEPGGGTWIALNEHGITLALVNWYAIAERVGGPTTSRGRVVCAASPAGNKEFVDSALDGLPLAAINPFRLVGVFPATREIFEWRWNLKDLVCQKRPWQPQQWISSGFDEAQAQRVRASVFNEFLVRHPAASLAALRRLHRSHAPECGAFSTCMHRTDAITVSATEIVVNSSAGSLRYHPGTPCLKLKPHLERLRLRRPKVLRAE